MPAGGVLFADVPIPRINAPETDGAPADGTFGRVNTMPLFPDGSIQTGFCTWSTSGTAAPAQEPPSQEKYRVLLLFVVQRNPQSCRNRPMPRIPLKLASCGSVSTTSLQGLREDDCPPNVGLMT